MVTYEIFLGYYDIYQMPKDDTFLVVAAWAFGSFKNAKSCENK
jgi:hypothetical protein